MARNPWPTEWLRIATTSPGSTEYRSQDHYQNPNQNLRFHNASPDRSSGLEWILAKIVLRRLQNNSPICHILRTFPKQAQTNYYFQNFFGLNYGKAQF